MLEVGTKLRKKYGSGIIGGETEITKREVVRDRHNGTTEIVYVVGKGTAYGCHTEEGIRKDFLFVDDVATAALNEEVRGTSD